MASVDPKYLPKRDKNPGPRTSVTTTFGPCPSPDELILLSDGSQKRAGDLVVGDTVKTKHEKTNKIAFSHNPFSMPQGDIDKIDFKDPLNILAYQYDIVCNGIELSSGAIRNHVPELMYKLFKIAGYSKEEVDNKFSGMINALSYGAPPHGGIAPGIDRIIMLLAGEKNIREVTMFPLNQNAQDLMMNAPSVVSEKQLKELNIKLVKKD